MSRSRLDNSLLAQLSRIDLTSVSQEPREQANRAVAAVVERLDSGRTDAVSWVLQRWLIVRDTTAPAPAPKNASAT
jgi:DNA-binding LacI/PurR family transcriptional regulator